MVETLLPQNATPWMGVVEQTSAERWDLRLSEILDAQDPWRAPAHLLPWLAQSRGVDLWYDDWPEMTKRRAIAEAPKLQRQKGTIAAIRGYLDLVSARVTYARLPSDRPYAGGLTEAQRAAWLARLPQLRIYPWRETLQSEAATADGQAYAGDEGAAHDFISLDPVIGRAAERMVLWREGVEVPLDVHVAERAPWSLGGWVRRFRFVRPIDPTGAAFLDGGALSGGAPEDYVGRDPVFDSVTEVRVQAAGQMQPIEARARVASAPFELVAQPFEPPARAAISDHAALTRDGVCATRDTAGEHVFRRTYLADPTVSVPDFADGARPDDIIANMQPVTAVLGVDVGQRDNTGMLFNDGGAVDGFVGSDLGQERLTRAVEAVRRAQGGTDIFVIDSTTFTPVTAGDAPLAGDGIRAGQMIERYQ